MDYLDNTHLEWVQYSGDPKQREQLKNILVEPGDSDALKFAKLRDFRIAVDLIEMDLVEKVALPDKFRYLALVLTRDAGRYGMHPSVLETRLRHELRLTLAQVKEGLVTLRRAGYIELRAVIIPNWRGRPTYMYHLNWPIG